MMAMEVEKNRSSSSRRKSRETLFTAVALLKACAKDKDLCKGRRIHEDLLHRGLLPQRSPHLATSLIYMYARCGLLTAAHELLQAFSPRNLPSWSALIAGYVHCDRGMEALECFGSMRDCCRISPDPILFTCVLKACGMEGALGHGRETHHEMVSMGFLEEDVTLGNAAVDMYAKCGALSEAHQVVEKLPLRNVVTWNTIISGYSQSSRDCHKALDCLDQMHGEGIAPNGVTFISALKACGALGNADKGREIHGEIVERGLLENGGVLGNALVDMYVKCGMLAVAHRVLEKLPARDVVSWSSLITGYAHHGRCYNALNCFEQMQSEGLRPNAVTFVCMLKVCACLGDVDKGKRIHEEAAEKGLVETELPIGNALVDMYAKCGLLPKAWEVLEEIGFRDVVSWNALISGYALQGQCDEALHCWSRLEREGLFPNAITLVSILNACARAGDINKGKRIHDDALTRGWVEKDDALGSALVDMYAKCGVPLKAQQVLEDLHVRTLVSWNALIAGYTQQGQGHEALKCLERLRGEGLSPNIVTLTCILKACGSVNAIHKGQQVHDEIVIKGFLDKNVRGQTNMYVGSQGSIPYLATTLISMYAKCGMFAKAHEVLRNLRTQCVDTWNSLIAGYARQGQCHQALDCLERMESEGHPANAVTLSSILKACGRAGAVEKGKCTHGMIVDKGMLEKDIVLGNGVIDMYARCGMLARAQQVLEELPYRNEVSWSALIAGCARRGKAHMALECFERMQREGLSPDRVAFACVLSACSHVGLLNEAKLVLESMTRNYGLAPKIEHLTSMVVSLGCAGQLEKAMSTTISVMSSYDRSAEAWLAVLAACRRWGNVQLGRLAFDQAIHSWK